MLFVVCYHNVCYTIRYRFEVFKRLSQIEKTKWKIN